MNDLKPEEYKIFDFLPGALIEINLSSRLVIYMNQIAFSIFGYSQSDIKSGIPVRDIFLNDAEYERGLEITKAFGLDSFESRKPYNRLEKQDLYDFMLKKKGGSSFYGECQASFVLDSEGVPTGIRMHIRDLTKQRKTEISLQESEEKYRTLVESSSDLIFLFDDKGNIFSANKAVLKALGKRLENILGKNISELFPPDVAQSFMQYIRQIYSTGESASLEITLPVEGSTVWISTFFNSVRNAAGEVTAVLCIGRDITKRKHAENQNVLALIEAKKANMAKDQFISNMSHEFRTPLTSIIGYTDYLKRNLGNKLKSKDRESFDSIYRNSNRLLRTVNAILSFSQTQAGKPQLDPQILYLNPLSQKICDELRPSAEKKGLKLEFIPTAKDDKIWLDEYSIYEALYNIIQNAIKYTNDGRITVQLTRIRRRLVLIISDTGIGISAEYYQQMFQPFSQASEGLAREYQGLGLGLALTKRYLDWNKVEIEVKSKQNQGSTFKLTFPQSETGNHI